MSHFYADVINSVFCLLSDHQMSPNLTHCSFKKLSFYFAGWASDFVLQGLGERTWNLKSCVLYATSAMIFQRCAASKRKHCEPELQNRGEGFCRSPVTMMSHQEETLYHLFWFHVDGAILSWTKEEMETHHCSHIHPPWPWPLDEETWLIPDCVKVGLSFFFIFSYCAGVSMVWCFYIRPGGESTGSLLNWLTSFVLSFFPPLAQRLRATDFAWHRWGTLVALSFTSRDSTGYIVEPRQELIAY